ncbi:hypothetical protein [Falsiroseomonas sp.]|uniref:hypothetical protein n=1 Tax=Falsiroseomonas sp. TaxID=2870721 RepID=UPI003F707E93
MPLPTSFIEALATLATACEAYRRATGHAAILVGGAATAIYTAGDFMSGDFDLVAADDAAFDAALRSSGFRREDRPGRLLVGYYHPDHPEYGFQHVSGRLFDGASDPRRIVTPEVTSDGAAVALPAFEDMIADRLAQAALASPTDFSRLLQARALFRLAPSLDLAYLKRRVAEEGGDFALLMPNEEPPHGQAHAGRTADED